MSNKIIDLLEEQVVSLNAKLEKYEAGSDEHKAIVDEIVKLTDRINDSDKITLEASAKNSSLIVDETLKRDQFKKEMAFKKEQLEEDMKIKREQFEKEMAYKYEQLEEQVDSRTSDEKQKERQAKFDNIIRIVERGIDIAFKIGIIAFVGSQTNKAYKFEETGTITTSPGRQHTNYALSLLKKIF